MMKIIKLLIVISAAPLFTGCDKNFVEINTNPYAIVSVDPSILFAGAQRTHIGTWAAEHTIVQHFVNPYNQGATIGFNFNDDIDANSNPKWDQSYPTVLRNMEQALFLLGDNPDRVNLRSMIRIWKAQTFMGLVDTYGDVPYFESGKAVINSTFYPKYDDDAAIYDDIYKEIKEAVGAMSNSADYVDADLFYGARGHASTKTANASDQVAKWKKLAYSLLLRLGMRYSKVDAARAQSIVAEAFAGGVMASNEDNAFVKYDGSLYVHDENNNLRNFSHFNYAAAPFVNQLKTTNDPRAKFILANFKDPGDVVGDPNPDVVLANQNGVPIGVTNTQIAAGGVYRGTRGTGLNYSQFNVFTIASPAAPEFFVTFAQTSLLLAEAAKRGWIPGGDATAKTYYDNAITANMASYALYPATTAISSTDVAAYLAHPSVAYTPSDALRLINTQYWVVNIRNGAEAFANFRRTGIPALSPNLFNNNLNGGFARRLSYPDLEASSNGANYKAAAAAIGGDKLTSKVFWDN